MANIEKEYKQLQARIDDLNIWLQFNTKHPDFLTKISERNHLLVKLEVKRQQRSGDWYRHCHPEVVLTQNIS